MSPSANRTWGIDSPRPVWRRNSPSRAVRSMASPSTPSVSSYGAGSRLTRASRNSRPVRFAIATRLCPSDTKYARSQRTTSIGSSRLCGFASWMSRSRFARRSLSARKQPSKSCARLTVPMICSTAIVAVPSVIGAPSLSWRRSWPSSNRGPQSRCATGSFMAERYARTGRLANSLLSRGRSPPAPGRSRSVGWPATAIRTPWPRPRPWSPPR